jgi:acyl-CoA hydrolase
MQIIDPERLDFSTIVRPGDTVMWGQAAAEPVVLTRLLMAQRHRIGRFSAFIGATWSDTLAPEHADHVSFVSYCGAGRNRELARAGVLDVWPGHYSQLPVCIANGLLRVDVLALQVSPPDEDGNYSLSMASDYVAAALATARCVVVEVNDQAPRTRGSVTLRAERISHAVRTSRVPMDAPSSPTGDVERAIARHVAGLVEDASTLQCGIGALPEAVLRELHNRRDLGFHSGAMGDSAAMLARTGVITNARKTIDRGVSVAGVLMGSREVRDFAHCNPSVQMRPVDYTHAADVLASIDRFVAVNSAIEVDLTGQVNAEVAGGVYVGAVGGAADFLRGAHRSKGGLPIVALPSRTRKGSETIGRIVAHLAGPVSTARSDAGIIVTEQGIADLRGLTLSQRVRRMLDIAHPDDRAPLERAASDVASAR